MFDNAELPPILDLKNKRKDYPASSLSQYGVSLSDPDKRIAEKNGSLKKKIAETYTTLEVPLWFKQYRQRFYDDNFDILNEIDTLSKMDLKKLSDRMGGNFTDLPYEVMDTLLVDGSDVPEVVNVLRKKRTDYLKLHPEMTRGVPGADEGIITFNGRFINKAMWATASPSEKRSALVGTNCFHYNSGTPGMDDSPDDRF